MIERLTSLGPVAWLLGNWQMVIAGAGAIALALVAAYFVGRDHGYDLRVSEQAGELVEAKALEDESEGEAAGERETDLNTIEERKEARDDAIENAQDDDAPSAASNALNCQRMREAGIDVSDLPACRGRARGAETGSRP